MWTAFLADSTTAATTSASFQSLLLGTHQWTYTEKKYATCSENLTLKLLFSTCKLDDFTCRDGKCVNLNARCNGKYECEDGSDEDQCESIHPKDGYNKAIVPPPLDGEDMPNINVSINILQIVQINEIQSLFHAKVVIKVTWYDRKLCTTI